MKRSEIALVLAKIQAYDRRTVGEADEMAWSEALEHVDYPDAIQAVKLYHQSGETAWMMPGHIIRLVAAQKDRNRALLHAAGPPDYPSDLTHAQEQTYRKLYQAHVKDGRSRDEATQLADHEFDAHRGELVAPPEHFRQALTQFTNGRSVR